MKTLKLALIATFAAVVSVQALPTYEPFTEFTSLVTANPTNAIDLCSNGLAAPSGEKWGSLNYSAKGATSGTETNGLDVLVTNYSSSVFTATALSSLLPATFPGFPSAGQAITTVVINPAQPHLGATIVGNSAVLVFNNDIARPTNGSKTFYLSYLFNIAQAGVIGTGNDGRYLAFLAASNLYEPSTAYPNWASLFNVFTAAGPRYCGHGIIQDGTGYYIGACDSSTGKDFATSPFVGAYNTAVFVVGSYTFNSTGADLNTVWVNPAVSGFGGPTPPTSPIDVQTMAFNMSDIGGLCLIDRVGSGVAGGVGTNFVANLLLGSTWSYVTGGPEFTNQPVASTVVGPGSTVILTGAAVAASQTVSYQWQNNGVNVNNGSGGAGGSAAVGGATTSTLTLSGVSPSDSGTYQLIATSSGTGYVLASSNAVVTVSDPGVIISPQPYAAVYGGSATFTATVVTTTARLTYAWYDGTTMLANGTQPDGSFASGATGNIGGGTNVLTLTLNNVSCADDGNYSIHITNAANNTATSTAAALSVVDPNISVQPPATIEAVSGQTVTIPVTAGGTGLSYQWQWTNGYGANGSGGEISGTSSSTLTISPFSANDAGTYSVIVSGSCGPSVTSSTSTVYLDTAPTGLTVTPAKQVQQVGTHLAIVGNVSGGSGLFHLLLQKGGVYLTNGTQADGSYISGIGTVLNGLGFGGIVLSNLQILDSGTYTVVVSNVAGTVSATTVVQVVPIGQLTLSSNNLIVTRVGDGYQPLSGVTGNTLYLDQFTTSGVYSNTIQVPDSGSNAVIVAGGSISAAVAEGPEEGYLTLSSNQQYLNFGGFCFSYPYTGGPDVTVGQQATNGSTSDVRGIYALNASGILALVYTNYGLYSGGHGFRDVYSTDGLTNFWTTGSAGSGTVKYVNAGPAGAAYTVTSPGAGIPALSIADSGGVCLGLFGTNLTFSDNETDGDSTVSTVWGLDSFVGAPMTNNVAAGSTTQILPGGVGHADDFTISPDLNTLYLADDDVNQSAGGNGGIQRWDYVNGAWAFAYNLQDTTGSSGTNGTRGLTVYFPPNITTWGQGVTGAILYATTSEITNNRIITFTDSGAGSTASVLAVAGPNDFYRGIRFGPVSVPLAATASPSSQSAEVGESVDFSSSASGLFAYYYPNSAGAYNLITVPPTTYQWYLNGVAIAGATNFAFNIPSVQASNAGSYTFRISNAVSTAVSPVAVLNISSFSANSNLVGWFKFNDGSGLTAADSSPYNDPGSLLNFPNNNSEWVPGLGGMDALNFANVDTNSDNVVVVPDAPQLNFTNNLAFTLSAFVNESLVNTNTQTSSAVIAKGYGNGGEQYALDFFQGYLRVIVRNSAGTVSAINATNIVPPLNQWVQVAATLDGTAGVLSLYYNGQLVATNSGPNSLLYTSIPLTIGNRTVSTNGIYSLPFYGKIQDVRLYNVALGQQDIQSIYTNLAPTTYVTVTYARTPITGGSAAPVLHFTGTAGATYHVWTTTNLALQPVTTKWTLLGTGTFTGGADTFTCPAGTGTAQFYTITQP